MLKGVKFVTLPVRNQATAISFWTEKVGLQIMTDQPFSETQRWVELGIGSHRTRLVPFESAEFAGAGAKYMNIAFYTDDVEKTYQELLARGVEFVSPPQKAEWGTSVQFKDQDGLIFLLSSK
jgi:catechol 2,3-dioxygenase-like lactoylglutathione lyase family enzyme